MRNIKTIFILVLSLILFAVSCSNEDKTGETDNTETIEIEAKDFPENLKGTYRDENVALAGFRGDNFDTKVSYDETTTKTKIEEFGLKTASPHLLHIRLALLLKNGNKQKKAETLLNLRANLLIVAEENI